MLKKNINFIENFIIIIENNKDMIVNIELFYIYIYIYQLGLSETYQPLIDSYDEKMFSVFVGILSTSVELQDNLTNEEYFKEFE